MTDPRTKAAQDAYRRALIARKLAVSRDIRRVELAIVGEQDRCFGLIMADFRAGTMSPIGIERRLDAFARVCAELIDSALHVGADDWWGSAVDLWAAAAVEEPRIVAALAFRPPDQLVESKATDRGSARSALIKILKAPSVKTVLEVINTPVAGESWRERLGKLTTRRVSQRGIASAIAEAYARGGNVDDVTAAIRPLVAGSATTARRIARTESLRVANEMHERSMAQADDLIIGHTYVATLDDASRPLHAARNGQVVKKGEFRTVFPDGPNCRCEWAPIFSTDVLVFGRPGRLPPEAKHVEAFADWYDVQSPARRVAVVGQEAYDRAVKRYGTAAPTWEQVTGASPALEVDRIRGALQERQAAALEARRAARRKDAA